jgi:hypothetical protein
LSVCPQCLGSCLMWQRSLRHGLSFLPSWFIAKPHGGIPQWQLMICS